MMRGAVLAMIVAWTAACVDTNRQPPAATPAASPVALGSAAGAPGAAADTPTAPRVTDGFCTDDQEETALACGDHAVSRSEDTLWIRPDSGPVQTFVNRPESPSPDVPGTDNATYTYLGALRTRRAQHVVTEQLYEMLNVYLVDGRSGRRTGIVGKPVASADGALVAAWSSALEGCDATTGLEIWRAVADTLAREFSLQPFDCSRERGWGPSNVAWRGDTLTLVANLAPGDSAARDAGTPERRPMLIVHGAGGWRVVNAGP